MRKPEKTGSMNRREFLHLGVAAAAGAVSFQAGGSLLGTARARAQTAVKPVYRKLGRTGLNVTVVSFGAMLTPEPEVIRAAIDLGVNYIDTARRYMGGRNEEIVGKAIRGVRDKVSVATKISAGATTRKEMFADLETSLSKLGTDRIDVIQLHSLSNGNRARDPEVRDVLREMRKQGKVRFLGVTTHTNQADVLDTVTKDEEKLFDVALVAYNFKSGPEITSAIARAAQAGIGVVAMKTQAGGYAAAGLKDVSPHQAALKWVLNDRNVTAAIPGMKDMAMLQEDLAAMNMPFTAADRDILNQYSQAVDPYYCHLCAQCEPTCPRGVAISDVNRALMYAEGYGNLPLARSAYREIQQGAQATACLSCPDCVARCVHRVDIRAKMAGAVTLLA